MQTFSTNKLIKKSGTVPVINHKIFGGMRAEGWQKESQEGRPLITVVTVLRNGAAYLERTMLSVLNQTYDNVEYIVVDAASTDGTLDIIKKYEPYIDVWISEPDKGSHDAINKAAQLITGDWVIILHCGDCFNNDRVLEDVFIKNKIYGDVVYGNFIGLVGENRPALYVSAPNTDKLWQGMIFCHQAMFARASLVKKFKYDTRYLISADYDFIMSCFLDRAIFQKVDVIVAKIDTSGASSQHWLKARMENWRIARRFKKSIKINLFHIYGIVYDVLFRVFKKILTSAGIYDFFKGIYRRTVLKGRLGRNPNIQKLN